MRQRLGFLICLAGAALALPACGPATRLVDTWKEPTVTSLHFEKVLAIVMLKQPDMRKTVEDNLAFRIRGAVPSYTLLSIEELFDVATAKPKVVSQGFDGVVVIQLADVDHQLGYHPGTASSFWGSEWYAGDLGSLPVDQGSLAEEVTVIVETRVFDLKKDKLVWQGWTKSVNPQSATIVLHDLATEIAREMKRQGLI